MFSLTFKQNLFSLHTNILFQLFLQRTKTKTRLESCKCKRRLNQSFGKYFSCENFLLSPKKMKIKVCVWKSETCDDENVNTVERESRGKVSEMRGERKSARNFREHKFSSSLFTNFPVLTCSMPHILACDYASHPERAHAFETALKTRNWSTADCAFNSINKSNRLNTSSANFAN